jgi:hypothetical protein
VPLAAYETVEPVDCGGKKVKDKDEWDEEALIQALKAEAERKKNEPAEPDEIEDDALIQDPVDPRFDPRSYYVTPRSWTTFWAILKAAGVRMRFVRNPHCCEVRSHSFALIGGPGLQRDSQT